MIDKILEDREYRYNKILQLIEIYKLPVICGKINYIGSNKNTKESEEAFSVLLESLYLKYNSFCVYSKKLEGYDGKSVLMVVDMNQLDAKKTSIYIEENHVLGRIFDIDVYIEDGTSVGRENLNINPRRCIICDEDARICMRTKKHTVFEVIEEIHKLIKEYGVYMCTNRHGL